MRRQRRRGSPFILWSNDPEQAKRAHDPGDGGEFCVIRCRDRNDLRAPRSSRTEQAERAPVTDELGPLVGAKLRVAARAVWVHWAENDAVGPCSPFILFLFIFLFSFFFSSRFKFEFEFSFKPCANLLSNHIVKLKIQILEIYLYYLYFYIISLLIFKP